MNFLQELLALAEAIARIRMGKKSAETQEKGNIKSIADLFGTVSSADPALESLFKQNVTLSKAKFLTLGWTVKTTENCVTSGTRVSDQ